MPSLWLFHLFASSKNWRICGSLIAYLTRGADSQCIGSHQTLPAERSGKGSGLARLVKGLAGETRCFSGYVETCKIIHHR